MSSLAFLPLEIFIVVLIIERIVDQSERKAKLQKLNMVWARFSTMSAITCCGDCWTISITKLKFQHFNLKDNWGKKEFQEAAAYADKLKIEMTATI